MPERNNSKNLTIAEVVILVLVCLFLLAVVPPALQNTRRDSSRITCRRNLSVIGRAIQIYTNDYDDELPRAGGRNSTWGMVIPNWMADNRFAAYGLNADGSGGQATITSSFYFLVKYMEVSPKTFICPGDSGATEFNLNDYGVRNREYIDLWDFGPDPTKHCSYAYHMPYGLYALTTSNEPGMAVAADRNPWMDSPAAEGKTADIFAQFNPDGGKELVNLGNAIAHQEKGQNVLFLDGHVSFEETPCCGIKNDNIYTYWDGGDIRRGGYPIPLIHEPTDRRDSFVVNEPVLQKTITKTIKDIRNVDSAHLKETSIVATLDCPMTEYKNVIWCSTFQIAWDKLKNDIIGEPIKVPEAEELAERLNNAEISRTDIQEESFYSAAGIVKDGIIEEIITEMKRRFPTEPEPDFKELDSLSSFFKNNSVVTYSFLDVDVDFENPFFVYKNGFKFENSNRIESDVKAFCAQTTSSNANSIPVREQVEILYYERGQQSKTDEFAVDLCKYTEPYQVVLACVPRCKTLREQIAAIEGKISEFKRDSDYKTLRKLRPIDGLIVPDILYKLTHKYTELLNKEIKNLNYWNYWFRIARQMIDFSLSRTGVTITSEVVLAPPPPFVIRPRRIEKPRYFYFNRPFLIYVKKRQGGTDPFFVMWVDNAELMQEFESK